jgi:hypothetical protein
MRSSWFFWVGPKINDDCSYIQKEVRDTEDRAIGHSKTEAETGAMQPQAWNHQKLEDTKKC